MISHDTRWWHLGEQLRKSHWGYPEFEFAVMPLGAVVHSLGTTKLEVSEFHV